MGTPTPTPALPQHPGIARAERQLQDAVQAEQALQRLLDDDKRSILPLVSGKVRQLKAALQVLQELQTDLGAAAEKLRAHERRCAP